MYSFLNLYSAPHARDGTRLDGARHNKKVWSLAPPCSNLRSFRSKWTVLKKVLVTLLGLLGAPRSDSAPHDDSVPGKFCPLAPSHYVPALCIHKLQSCIITAPFPKALSWACYASTTKLYDKTVELWHAITRGSDIVSEQERSPKIAANDRSVNWNLSFHTSGPHWLNIRKGRLCDITLMRMERDETAKAYIDEIIEEFASIRHGKCLFQLAFLCNLTGYGWICLCLDGIMVFEQKWCMNRNKYFIAQFRLNVFCFKRSCRLQLQYVVWFFCEIYNLVRQHYVDL